MTSQVRLLDATLRDGSYCIDFQFTAADTAVLVGILDAAGVCFIELGHGSGSFNHKAPANFRSKTRQGASDEEYFAAARRAAPRAKLGVITGPFGMEDMSIIAAHKLDFVRAAVMADRALEPVNLQMAERAKALGLMFSINLMQTTAITPARCAEIALEYRKRGTDFLYVVDSSGGLLPKAVSEYVARVREASDITVGYHAHHNSGMAIACCIAAVEAGATMVDGTLQGLGRDVGNAPTEQLLFMLQRLGHERSIDVEGVSHAGDLVRALLLDKGQDPTYFAAGAAEIHSSNVEALVKLARDKGVGARSFLAAIAQGEAKLIGAGMKTFPEEVVGPALAKATRLTDTPPRAEMVEALAQDITRASSTSLPVLADVLFSRAAKWHKQSVLHVVPADQLPFGKPVPWTLDRVCGITVGLTPDQLTGTIDFGDRHPNVLVIDPAIPSTLFGETTALRITDAFAPVALDATLALASVCVQQTTGRVWIVAEPTTASQLAARVDALGKRVSVASANEVPAVASGDHVIVAGYRDIPADIAALAGRGARLLRPGFATATAARIAALLELRDRLQHGGTGELVDAVFVPAAGQTVVDDPSCPSAVIAGSDTNAAALARARSLVAGRGRL